jgi:protein TonB
MSLRCLLFTSDEGTAAPILQALTGLGVEGEHCSNAVATVEKVTHQSFQLVIIDWDQQPEAGLLLTAARERKAAERPLTLAIVSNDVSVPQALQAGANSILRKPILFSQVKDTLTTARDLLRSKQESAATAAQAAAAGATGSSVSSLPASMERGQEKTLRAGEFLQSAPPAPGGQFVTESDAHSSLEPSSVEVVDPLANLEPMAASVAHEEPTPPPSPPSEARGLEWYKKTRGGTLPPIPAQALAAPASTKPELLGFDQTPSHSPTSSANFDESVAAPAAEAPRSPRALPEQKQQRQEQKKEAELFAYMADGNDSDKPSRAGFPLKKAIIGALFLASCAIAVAPQAPWHPKLQASWVRGRQVLHAWLNPQPITPVQAPVAHEDFGRAGDEYKLPVAENIPDATTDPSQIQVLPAIDPTIKKPNNEGSNALQLSPVGDATGTTPGDQVPTSATQVPENQSAPSVPETTAPASGPGSEASVSPGSIAPPPVGSAHTDPFAAPVASAPTRPAPPKNSEPHPATAPGNVPSSLKSHMVTMAPETGGNKAPESAMPSIEPVSVPEFTERALLSDQPAIPYPANAKAQQGTVVLQVLIGRDGTVQDAKFLQGSLLFARNAIDGVKLWKFKPYAMNGRPVSVQTLMTITFKPGS